MPEAVDVGSVLGGRYKVTAYVLASAEKDLVLDGVDQVLNRPVSILVASAGNAAQVATSARELATGDRNDSVQVLDLSLTDGTTYLVTNRASAADLLDLIVRQEDAPTQKPYVEPFFTDTLGSEIFGGPRSTEPETYDDEYEEYEAYDDRPQARPSRLSGLTRRFGRRNTPDEDVQDDDTSALPPVAVPAPAPAPAPQASNHRVPPRPARKPGGSSAAPAPSVDMDAGDDDSAYDDSAYDDGTYDDGRAYDDLGRRRHDDSDRRHAVAGMSGAAAAGVAAGPRQPERAASRFPLSGRDENDDHDTPDEPDEYDDDDTPGARPFTRILVGAVLAILLVVAVVLAATQLGSISGGNQLAGDDEPDRAVTEPAEVDATTAPPSPTAEPTPDIVEPVITGISRLVPDNPGLDAANDRTLPLIIDGNPSTYWGNQVYASDTFGGLATNLALVVELEEASTISEVSIAQLNGSGGNFTVLVNDQPSLDGAQQIAQGGFTGPTVTLPIPDGAEGQPTGRYVMVNFTQLPRLNIQAQYPFGVRIGEISVS